MRFIKIFAFLLCVLVGFLGFYFKKYFSPTVSVVMVSHDYSQFLVASIQSVLNQSYDDFEFIIVNDHASLDVSSALSHFEQTDSRVRIIQNEKKLGVSKSLDKAIERARGKYIAFMDDKAQSYSSRLLFQARFLDLNPSVDAVANGGVSTSFDKDKFPTSFHYNFSVDNFSVVSQYNIPPVYSSMMMRRDFILKHNLVIGDDYFDFNEVFSFWAKFNQLGGRVFVLASPLIAYEDSDLFLNKYRSDYIQFLNEKFHSVLSGYEIHNSSLSQHEECLLLTKLKNMPSRHYSENVVEALIEDKKCHSHYNFLKVDDQIKFVGIQEDKYILNDMNFNVVEKNDDSVLVYYAEKYIKFNKNGSFLSLTDSDVLFKIKHPHWSDYIFLFPEAKKVFFLSGARNDTRLVQVDHNSITLDFGHWGIETFEKNKDGIFVFTHKHEEK